MLAERAETASRTAPRGLKGLVDSGPPSRSTESSRGATVAELDATRMSETDKGRPSNDNDGGLEATGQAPSSSRARRRERRRSRSDSSTGAGGGELPAGATSGTNSPDDNMSTCSELTDENLEAHNERMSEEARQEYEREREARNAAPDDAQFGDDAADLVVMQRYYTLGRTRLSTLPLLNASDEVTKHITSKPVKGWRRTANRDAALSRSSLSSIAESEGERSLSSGSDSSSGL